MQRLLKKKLPGYQGLNYTARLEIAGLCTLELKRLRADLYFCYTILHGLIATPIDKFFTLDRSGLTRGHSWKLKPITPRLDIRLYFFSYRVVNVWNSLSPSTVGIASIHRTLIHRTSIHRSVNSSQRQFIGSTIHRASIHRQLASHKLHRGIASGKIIEKPTRPCKVDDLHSKDITNAVLDSFSSAISVA